MSAMEVTAEQGRTALVGLFLAWAAVQDARYREIPIRLFQLFGLSAVIFLLAELGPGRVYDDPYSFLMNRVGGALIGVLLLVLCRMTRGAVGSGDGVFFLISGLLLGVRRNFLLFAGGVFLSGLYSLGLLVVCRFRNRSLRRTDTLPFLPFAAVAGVLFMAAAGPGR